MKSTLTFMAVASFAFVTPAYADEKNHDPLNVDGVWLTEAKSAKVEIADCGDGTPCGTIIWIDAPDPSTVLDTENPDPALRSNTMVGTKMIHSFKRKSKAWKSGKIYNPEDGKSYKSSIRVQEDGTLKVKGCIGPICQGQIWTRAEN